MDNKMRRNFILEGEDLPVFDEGYQMQRSTFILENVIPPEFDEGIEFFPAGYINFYSFLKYKKMKNLDDLIRRFLKRLPEIEDDYKVFKCLNLIENLVDKCGKVLLATSIEETFGKAFPGIVKFIKKVGFDYGGKNKLYNVGINIMFNDKMSGMVKNKYCVILYKLYDQNIWPFVNYM